MGPYLSPPWRWSLDFNKRCNSSSSSSFFSFSSSTPLPARRHSGRRWTVPVTASASARPAQDSARAPRWLRKLHRPQQWLQLIDTPSLPRVRNKHQRRRLCLSSIFSKWGTIQNCYDRKQTFNQRYLKHILSQRETGTNTEIICFTVETLLHGHSTFHATITITCLLLTWLSS